MSSSNANLGIIGCGNIFERYMRGLARYQNLAVVWCSDVDLAMAKARAKQFEILSYGTLDKMLEGDRIDVAINLTPPNVPAATSTSALEAVRRTMQPAHVTLWLRPDLPPGRAAPPGHPMEESGDRLNILQPGQYGPVRNGHRQISISVKHLQNSQIPGRTSTH